MGARKPPAHLATLRHLVAGYEDLGMVQPGARYPADPAVAALLAALHGAPCRNLVCRTGATGPACWQGYVVLPAGSRVWASALENDEDGEVSFSMELADQPGHVAK